MYQGVTPAPDWAFVKKLREFDSKLQVTFDRRYERFIISKKVAFGSPFGVLAVNDEFGGFRQPDDRDIRTLYNGDLWRHGGVKERIRSGEETLRAHKEKEDRDTTQAFKERSRDDAIQLRNTYRKATNSGSKTPEFRRVDVKSGGKTLEEIRAARAAGQDPWEKAE